MVIPSCRVLGSVHLGLKLVDQNAGSCEVGGAQTRFHIPRMDKPGLLESEVWGTWVLRTETLRPGEASAWDLKS